MKKSKLIITAYIKFPCQKQIKNIFISVIFNIQQSCIHTINISFE